MYNIVLIEPEIPNNTGNIGRTCVGLGARLHLVGPLGFSIDDKQVRRAGLDYWEKLNLIYHRSKKEWLNSLRPEDRVHLIETGGDRTIYDVKFEPGDHLVFGRETTGIPKDILGAFPGRICSIPFPGEIRSFNVSNCVAVVACEAMRQNRPTLFADTSGIKY